jgi:hypothetical protein
MLLYRLALGAIIFSLSACSTRSFLEAEAVTEMLWQQRYYNEAINGFYIDEAASHVLVTTADYAYILPCEKQLCRYLRASQFVEINMALYDLVSLLSSPRCQRRIL